MRAPVLSQQSVLHPSHTALANKDSSQVSVGDCAALLDDGFFSITPRTRAGSLTMVTLAEAAILRLGEGNTGVLAVNLRSTCATFSFSFCCFCFSFAFAFCLCFRFWLYLSVPLSSHLPSPSPFPLPPPLTFCMLAFGTCFYKFCLLCKVEFSENVFRSAR